MICGLPNDWSSSRPSESFAGTPPSERQKSRQRRLRRLSILAARLGCGREGQRPRRLGHPGTAFHDQPARLLALFGRTGGSDRPLHSSHGRSSARLPRIGELGQSHGNGLPQLRRNHSGRQLGMCRLHAGDWPAAVGIAVAIAKIRPASAGDDLCWASRWPWRAQPAA